VRPSRRVLVISILTVMAVVTVLWFARAVVLARAGGLLVEEGPPMRADTIIVFTSHPVPAAVEAADLFRAGYAPRIVILAAPPGAEERILSRLAITIPAPHERAILVMVRSGVPRRAITVMSGGDGTNGDVRAVARWARRARPARLLVVAGRSHTRRIATLLRPRLPGIVVVMRAPRDDGFDPSRWWRDGSMAREVMTEALRWINSVWLGDLWADEEERAGAGGQRPCASSSPFGASKWSQSTWITCFTWRQTEQKAIC
jgi:hypothetical protein